MAHLRNTRLTLLLLISITVAGCNTVQGVGQDIESVGKKGEEVLK